jgi:hypothetical protein
MRQIRKEAPVLLEASKEALRFLLRQDPHPLAEEEQKRKRVMAVLKKAIDAAEPPTFDERDTSIRLVMTPATWKTLSEILKERACRNKDDKLVYEAVVEGLKETKQRVYVTLAINPMVLRRLRFILKHTSTSDQEKPFKRMAEEIEKNGLTKNPMEILAQMGL